MSFINKLLKPFLGDKNKKEVNAAYKKVHSILSLENEFENLSIDHLRAKTVEFKAKIADSTKAVKEQVDAIKTQIEETDDFYKKDELFDEIERLDKVKYETEQKVLNEILPEAFLTVKEAAKRFTANKEITVKATPLDRQLSSEKEYVEMESDDVAVWKNTWNAAGRELVWDMVHYDVQLIGGLVLHDGKIAEMQTGEGKTLVSTLPVYLNALSGRGVHLITVNDYLAKRDAAWNGPIYEFLGLSVDCIDKYQPGTKDRQKAYASDITYGTNNEFGFDYLRDNMANSVDRLVQRELNYAIIDEVDSVLVDEARTPLIISGPVSQGDKQEYVALKTIVESLFSKQKKELTATLQEAKKLLKDGETKKGAKKLYQAFRGLPKHKPLINFLSEEGIKQQLQKTEAHFMQDNKREMHKVDKDLLFVIDEKNNSVELTDRGIDQLSVSSDEPDFFVLPDLTTDIAKIEEKGLSPEKEAAEKDAFYRDFAIKSERIHTMNQLLKAYTLFEKDVEYVVMGGQVKIVDEQTGRIMDGRRYSDGLHQALEAKEAVKVEAASQTYATITLQNYFRMYNKLSGMTGTAVTEASELWQIYKLDVVAIPTNRPIQRKDENDQIFRTQKDKFHGIVKDVLHLSQIQKRPVLVGTTSVEMSELLSRTLKNSKITHNVLNAKLHKKEADIVQNAGQQGMVTIATNMAGRGTDIKLSDEAKNAGGLAIIGTERHESRRVDRQLRGRSGRQGDPGSSQFYVSMEDNLMRLFGSDKLAKWMDRFGFKDGEMTQHSMLTNAIEGAQKKVEENNFGIRKRLIDYDDVMNKQRQVIYKRRKNALFGERLKVDISQMIYDTAVEIVSVNKSLGDYKNFEYELIKFFTMQSPVSEQEFAKISERSLIELVYEAAEKDYQEKCDRLSETIFPLIKDVYEKNADSYKRIQIPLTDGIKAILVSTDLEKAYKTNAKQLIDDFEKDVLLNLIEEHWKEHLRDMDDLKRSVQNASFEQKDPLVIYKEESFYLFKKMADRMRVEVISFLYKGEIPEQEADPIQEQQARKQQQIATNKAEVEANVTEGGQLSTNKSGEQKVVAPRKVEKVGRNEIVVIRNIASGETKELKFKQATPLLNSEEWVFEKVV